MKERQLMEKNLARLLRQIDYKSCGSDVEQEIQDSPVNPFMKRVFQRKLRRSSVESENVNPNLSINNTVYQSHNFTKIKNIIEKGHNCLSRLQKHVCQQIQQNQNMKGKKSIQKTQKIIENLQKSVEFITEYIQKQMKDLNEGNNSIYHMQYYHCSNSIQQDPSTAKKQKRNRKLQKQHKSKNTNGLGGSMVSQSTYSSKQNHKSVYESVLEERRNRKTKQSRIV